MDDATAQKLYERLVELQEQAGTLDEHLRNMQEQLRTLDQTIAALTDLEALPAPRETWVPIAPGAYVKAKTEPASSVLLAVGAGVAVEKTPAQVRATLAEHKQALESLSDQAIAELKVALAEMDAIKAQVESEAPAEVNAGHKPHKH